MIPQLVVYALLTSAVLALGTVLVSLLLRSSVGGTRFLWAAAMGASLALVGVAPARVRTPAPAVSAVDTRSEQGNSLARAARGVAGAAPPSFASRLVGALPRWSGWAFGLLWVASAVALLGLILLTYHAHRRRARRAQRVVVDGSTVLVTPSFGPAVVGAWPGEIVVPRWLLDRSREEQALVVRHERAHIDAGDPSLLLVGCVIAALMPWNPATWYMLARLRLAIELDCDRRVLRAGAAPRAYGALLIELTSQAPAPRLGAPAFACRTSHLERRILAMTARPLPHRRARFAAAVGAATIALLAACRADLPTAAQVEHMDVHAIEEVAIPKLGIDASHVEYVLDGVLVDRSVVAALPPGSIESIAVVRAEVPRMLVSTKKDGEIPVTTVAPLQFRDVKIPYGQEVEAPREKPLFVIDGVIGGDLEMSRLEPDRIETVEVVKGEAARRVYGERAANGVVLVKTWPDGTRRPLTRDSVRGTLSPLARPLVIRRDSSSAVNVIRRDSVAPSVRKP